MKINTTNYEEYFLLYIDNELSTEQKTAVENFIEANPSYQKEFELLKQTFLTPEHIEFEDKVLLYRLEDMEAKLPSTFKQSLYRNEAKVIEGYFNTTLKRSIASVAAIVILIFGYNLMPTTGKQNIQNQLANNTGLPIIKNESSVSVSANSTQNRIAQNEVPKIAQNNTKPSKTLPSIAAEKADNTPPVVINESIANSAGQHVNNENEMRASPSANNTTVITAVNEKITSNETSIVAEAKEAFENINTDNPENEFFISSVV